MGFKRVAVRTLVAVGVLLVGDQIAHYTVLTDGLFLGNPVEFDCEGTRMTLGRDLLEKRVTQDETSLRHFLKHPVLIMLTGSYANDSWTARVRELLHRRLSNMPELKEVAAALEVHPQTLRRRLATEGTTFKDIKNHVRRDTALHYLGKQGLSIEEIGSTEAASDFTVAKTDFWSFGSDFSR